MSDPLLIVITNVVTVFVTSGGFLAWLRLGPERRKITLDAAQIAASIQTNVLKDINEDRDRQSDMMGQLRLELASRDEENMECRKRLHELQETVGVLQRELERQGRLVERQSRMTVLVRQKSHLMANHLGNLRVHIDNLLCAMCDAGVEITPDMRPEDISRNYQAEMNKIQQLENDLIEEAIMEISETPDS